MLQIFVQLLICFFQGRFIDMKKMQHQAHTAVQENNYGLRLYALQQFLQL